MPVRRSPSPPQPDLPPEAKAEQLIVQDLENKRDQLEASLLNYMDLKRAGLSWPQVDEHAKAIAEHERRQEACRSAEISIDCQRQLRQLSPVIMEAASSPTTPKQRPGTSHGRRRPVLLLAALIAAGLLLGLVALQGGRHLTTVLALLKGDAAGVSLGEPRLSASPSAHAPGACHGPHRSGSGCAPSHLMKALVPLPAAAAENATAPIMQRRRLTHRPLWSSLNANPALVEEPTPAAQPS